MKKLCFILFIPLMLLGCNREIYHWEFHNSSNEVSQIFIIEIIDELEEYREIEEIDLKLAQEVYDDIMSIEMKRYGTNLSAPSGKCFLIVFNNGEYDIISQKESKHFRKSDGDIIGYNSWLCCDESEFEELINKYLNNKMTK